MKIQQIVFLSFGLVFVLAGSAIVGKILLSNNDESSNYAPTAQSENYKPNTSANTQTNSSGNLQVQGATNNSSNRNSLPTPDSFEVYDQYTNNQNASYIDISVGQGNESKMGDTVAMAYQGWLTDGTLFDQSKVNDEGKVEAFTFTIGQGQVIQGWEQGIVGMKEGGVRRLIVPSTVGYGPTGQGTIPANATLVFDVQLLAIQ